MAKSDGLSAEERAAIKARNEEIKAEKRAAKAADKRAMGEQQLTDALAALPEPDRTLGERLHAIVGEEAPALVPRTWYGMPAWSKGDAVLCFFQPADKFKARYATFGFNGDAALDDGPMWPTSFALLEITDAVEAELRALVRRAVG